MSRAYAWRERWLAVGFVLMASGSAWAQDCVPAPDADCDLDGFTPDQGDCDDGDPEVNPNVKEVCGDQLDNNCDGFFDEGCEIGTQQGNIKGGGGCTSGDAIGGPAALILLPLLGLRRRRRSIAVRGPVAPRGSVARPERS